jgi:hypothetical protein
MIEAVRTSGTSVYFNETTRRYILEGSNLHIHSRKNPKSQSLYSVLLGSVALEECVAPGGNAMKQQ